LHYYTQAKLQVPRVFDDNDYRTLSNDAKILPEVNIFKTYVFQLRELNAKYEKAREENNNRQAEFDNSISEFASKSHDDHLHIQQLKSSIDQLTDEKNSLGRKVESLENEISELQQKEESLLNKSVSFHLRFYVDVFRLPFSKIKLWIKLLGLNWHEI
jgi:predicted RNase H-like nuclease (RuvC/YqgF family)